MISSEDYNQAIHNIYLFIQDQTSIVDLELIQNRLLGLMQQCNRQIIKLKESPKECR